MASLFVGGARAADPGPIGPWRSTNDCFLAAFLLSDGGGAQALYRSGEQDGEAAWTWDGATLSISSMKFPFDSFAGRLKEEKLEADYVWHELEKDELHRQACLFERFAPGG